VAVEALTWNWRYGQLVGWCEMKLEIVAFWIFLILLSMALKEHLLA